MPHYVRAPEGERTWQTGCPGGVRANELDVTIYNLLVERGHDVREVIQATSTENLDVIPANIDLSAAEVQLVGEVAREQILARVLRPVVRPRRGERARAPQHRAPQRP